MKKLYILLFTVLISAMSFGQTAVFINEIHYDNTSGDVGEGVEIAGPAGTDLSTYTITPYNGNNGATYAPITTLSGSIPDEGGSGYGTLWFAIVGLQNGAPDGIALDNGGVLIQFLSYEGSFVGVGGVAGGITSTDIGVSENGTEAIGMSLQLIGSGDIYEEFTWSGPIASTNGTVNTGQTFTVLNLPTLAMNDGPTNGETLVADPETGSPGNATIDFITANFVMSNDAGGGVSDNSGDGFIKWTLVNTVGSVLTDSGSIFTSNDPLTTYLVNGITQGETYVFTAELVDNAGAPLSSPVVYSFTFTVATYNDVADLATLRAQTVDPDTYYRVTGEVVNTNTITGFGNPIMYFQDSSGGIMVNDQNYATSPFYNIGDAVSNIKGHLVLVSGVLQLIPSDIDWGTPNSTGNAAPNVQTVTIATLLTDWDSYESQLVNINNATFADAGGTFVAAIGTTGNYDITDDGGTSTTIFRTAFGNADYIGQTIPAGSQNLAVIVSEFFGTVQVTARSLADITLDSKSFDLEAFKMYPNPTNLGYVNILSKSQIAMKVSVYDVLGKQVINETINNNRLDISTLSSGIYILKISQDDATTTKKLVIK